MFKIKNLALYSFLSQVLLIQLCLLALPNASAKVIQFPDEELASEYVLPVFAKKQVVLDRNVRLTKRFEFSANTGLRMDEPLHHVLGFSGSVAFYWSEFSGLGVSGLFFMPGLSPTGMKLQTEGIDIKKKSVIKKVFFEPLLAPRPMFATFVDYHFSPFYGKVSITKKAVFNFALYSFFGLGAIAFQHGAAQLVMNPIARIGIGQKSYFNSHLAFKIGMDFIVYRGPNPISPLIMRASKESPRMRPEFNQFKRSIFVRFLVHAGFSVIL